MLGAAAGNGPEMKGREVARPRLTAQGQVHIAYLVPSKIIHPVDNASPGVDVKVDFLPNQGGTNY